MNAIIHVLNQKYSKETHPGAPVSKAKVFRVFCGWHTVQPFLAEDLPEMS